MSFFAWAVAGLVFSEDAWSIVRWCIACLHVTAGVLIVRRDGEIYGANWFQLCGCIPAIVTAGVVFAFARPTDRWSVGPQIIFSMATCWTVVSLYCLGKSFAVFPSLRSIVANGPYRVVRHPAYSGEILLLLCCGWAAHGDGIRSQKTHWVWLAILIAIIGVAIRIRIEEAMLKRDDDYEAYRRNVHWRLIPLIW